MEVTPMGTYRPCCLYNESIPNLSVRNGHSIHDAQYSDYMKTLRQQFVNGEKPKGCNACWQEESVPNRMSKRNASVYKVKTPTEFNEAAVVPLFLDLKLGNICNLKCRICGSWSSSKWAQEEIDIANGNNPQAIDQLKKGQWPRRIPSWWKSLEDALEHIEYLEFTGGEPFLISEHFDLLQVLVDKGYSKKIGIHYNTNGTIWPVRGVDLWKQFKRVEIAFSIDDTGKRFEYQRHGSNWRETEEVVKTAYDTWRENNNLALQICTTFNIQNAYYWPETEDWIGKQDIVSIHYNILQEPPMFNLRNLPDHVKYTFAEKMLRNKLDTKINGIIGFMNLPGQDMSKDFIEKIKLHDSYRNEKFEDAHPEVWRLLNG
jgi:sulfatase maturation enzyme AslB (radical SAM superfamily)